MIKIRISLQLTTSGFHFRIWENLPSNLCKYHVLFLSFSFSLQNQFLHLYVQECREVIDPGDNLPREPITEPNFPMKCIVTTLAGILLAFALQADPVSGTFTIPGTPYSTVKDAIAALNAQGVGTGGATFNVTAGYTETFPSPLSGTLTATGTAANPVIFRKSGTGANPLITAALNGTSTSTDGIIKIAGGDYITFDGIDLAENPANTTATTQMEWGYALVKGSSTAPFNGCQFVTIRNCTITLNKTNPYSVGIYANNHIATATPELYITATTDAMNNCKFYGNTISNVWTGIQLSGYLETVSPYTLYDQNNEIGVDGANTISNIGAGSTYEQTYGIYTTDQNGLKIANNIINTGAIDNNSLYGIYFSVSAYCSTDVYSNTITLTYDYSVCGIYNYAADNFGGIINIHDNAVINCAVNGSYGVFYGIQSLAYHATVNIYSNTISGNTLSATGDFIALDAGGADHLFVYNNVISDNTKNSAGNMICLSTSTGNITAHHNTISTNYLNAPAGTNNALYGIYNYSTPSSETYYENEIYDLNIKGSSAASYCQEYGFYLRTGILDMRSVYNNHVHNLAITNPAGGDLDGILNMSGATSNIYKNKIENLMSAGADGFVSGIVAEYNSTLNLYNNFIYDLTAPESTKSLAALGIYLYSGSFAYIENNTVWLNASSTSASTFGTAGIYRYNTVLCDVRNNLVVNLSTPGPTGGRTVAFEWGDAWASSKLSSTSDNNDLYAGTPSSTHLIFYDYNSVSSQTLADYQATVAPRELNAFSENPPFLNVSVRPYDLHLSDAVATRCESGGVPVNSPVAITDDIDGDPRYPGASCPQNPSYPPTSPDVGADEFGGIPIRNCTTPAPGNTVASLTNLCSGQSTTLSLQNPPSGTGNTYQWQSSANGTTYSNIPSGNEPAYVTTPVSSMYYRCLVTCNNGPSSEYSTAVYVPFSNSITSTTPGTRCGTGTVSLAAAGTGTTLRWYNNPSGGLPLGTGSPFTTPTINTTTTFYAGSESVVTGTTAVGSGSTTCSTLPNPFYAPYSNTHNQYLILASELIAAGLSAGNITALGLNILSGTSRINSVSIKLAHSTATSLTDFLAPSFTTVYSVLGLTPVVGINMIPFSTPFTWNGTSNIVIEFCQGYSLSTSELVSLCTADSTAYNSVVNVYLTVGTSGSTICSNTTSSKGLFTIRPQFYFTGQVVCSSPRSGVVATVTPPPALTLTSNPTLCNNAIGTLAVTSNTSDYNTFVWSPATYLFTDAACTVAYNGTASATTLYTRSTSAGTITYTCTAANTSTLCNNTAQVAVTILPSSPAVTATPNLLCSSGSSALALTGAAGYGSAQFQWQSSPDNSVWSDISGATAGSYSTPTLVSTTYYRLIVRNSAGTVCSTPQATVTVLTPQVTGATPGTRCNTGTVTLGATASSGATLNWYSAASGGTSLGTGTTFTTPSITTTTNYWVDATAPPANQTTVGPATPTAEGGTIVTLTSSYNVYFTTLSPAILVSTDIFPIAAAQSFTFRVYSGSGTSGTLITTVSGTTSASGGSTAQVVTLNCNLPTAGAYTLTMSSMPSSGIRYNSTNATYPYTSTYANITGNNYSSSRYIGYYRWVFGYLCTTPRTLVTATVLPPPDFTITAGKTVCNNEVNTLEVISDLASYTSYTWSPVTYLYTDPDATAPYTNGTSFATLYQRSSVAGSVTYTCSATNSVSGCYNSGQATIIDMQASPVISAVPDSLCQSGTSVMTLNPSTGYGAGTLEWQSSANTISWSTISGATGVSYTTPTLTGTTYYRVLIRNSSGSLCVIPLTTIVVNNPQITGTTPASRCGTGTVPLGATANGSNIVRWFAASTGGTSLGTGNTFTTPSISITTTYYAEPSIPGNAYPSVGPASPTAEGGTIGTSANSYGFYFTTLKPTTIYSVDIFPVASGQSGVLRVISGTGTGGTVLTSISFTTSVSGGATAQNIAINYSLPTPGNYTLYLSTMPSSGISRNTSGTAFPYTSSFANITGNSYSSSYYPGLYHWVFYTGCVDSRTPVIATVNPVAAIAPTASPSSICPGFSSNLNVTSTNDPNYLYTWTPGNMNGAAQTISPATSTTYTATATDIHTGCTTTGTANVTVNIIPSAVDVTPSTAPVGSIQLLTATGGVLPGNFVFGASTTTNATTGYPAPYTNYAGGTKHQMLIRAGELLAAGLTAGMPILSLSFTVTAVGPSFLGNLSSFQVSMKNTTSTVLSGTSFETGLTRVYGPVTQAIPTSGIPAQVMHTLTTPFTWDGSSNLVIETSYSNANTGNSNTYVQMQNSDPGFISTNWYKADGVSAATILAATMPTGSGNARPNIVLNPGMSSSITWSPLTDLYTNAGGTVPYTGTATASVYANPVIPAVYKATATGSNGCTSKDSCLFDFFTKTLYVKVFVEGMYHEGALNKAQDVSDPDLPQVDKWPGTEADTISVMLIQDYGAQEMWPYPLPWNYEAHGLSLGTDGNVTVSAIPGTKYGNYYIVVRHRSSVETWSAAPVSFSGIVTGYDFTTPDGKAWGSGPQKKVETGQDVYAMFSGEVTDVSMSPSGSQDGYIDIFDNTLVFNYAQGSLYGYVPEDITGVSPAGGPCPDGFIDIFDMAMIFNNMQNSVAIQAPWVLVKKK
jgi:hypothetical protein